MVRILKALENPEKLLSVEIALSRSGDFTDPRKMLKTFGKA